MKPMQSDGYGKLTTYTRFSGAVRTEFKDGIGYFWAHLNSVEVHGPFENREAAKKDEIKWVTSQ